MSQSTGMLSRDQLLYLFDRFSHLTSLPDVKKRISDAVQDNQEAVAVTTAIQEEIFLEMGVDPGFGIGCLGKVNMMYENDRDLMIRFYGFVAKEELACDEAELGADEFAKKLHNQHDLQAQQLEMLKYMRKFDTNDQSAILEKVNSSFILLAELISHPDNNRLFRYSIASVPNVHDQMQSANFNSWASIMPMEQIPEVIRTKATPMAKPN